ncbi:MAG: hypothetical protein VXY92_04740, partial [Planctomycetota bacterium]|nr:hypothetical protein [Planctomycetota bacterium]
PISIVAAGSIQIDGEILRRAAPAPGQSALLLASGADLKLGGALPLNTMLALESGRRGGGGSIYGVRGAARVYPVTFTYGVAPGASFVVSGMLPWRRLPEYVDGGVLQVGGVAGEVEVEWQATPADPIRGSVPDLSQGRPGRWQAARSGDVVVAGAGAFVRLRLRSTVSSDRPIPSIERLWIVEQR